MCPHYTPTFYWHSSRQQQDKYGCHVLPCSCNILLQTSADSQTWQEVSTGAKHKSLLLTHYVILFNSVFIQGLIYYHIPHSHTHFLILQPRVTTPDHGGAAIIQIQIYYRCTFLLRQITSSTYPLSFCTCPAIHYSKCRLLQRDPFTHPYFTCTPAVSLRVWIEPSFPVCVIQIPVAYTVLPVCPFINSSCTTPRKIQPKTKFRKPSCD